MCEILLAGPNKSLVDSSVLNNMYAFRKRIFHDKLNWDVSHQNGLEMDYFDTLDPTYIVAKTDEEQVNGCWRFLPTTGPYMLSDIFPQLLRGEKAPHDKNIWEISRFAVEPSDTIDHQQAATHPVTLMILQKAYEVAIENSIDQFVAVTSVAMERHLKKIGIPMYRFGDRKSSRVGKVKSVACWIDVNDQFRNAVYNTEQFIMAKYREAA